MTKSKAKSATRDIIRVEITSGQRARVEEVRQDLVRARPDTTPTFSDALRHMILTYEPKAPAIAADIERILP